MRLGLDELVERWTVLADDQDLIAGKRGPTRLGFALLLKFFTQYGRFPEGRSELPDEAVEWVARQGHLAPEVLAERLMLAVYAYGTNCGIKSVASAEGHGEDEIRYVRRRDRRRDVRHPRPGPVGRAVNLGGVGLHAPGPGTRTCSLSGTPATGAGAFWCTGTSNGARW